MSDVIQPGMEKDYKDQEFRNFRLSNRKIAIIGWESGSIILNPTPLMFTLNDLCVVCRQHFQSEHIDYKWVLKAYVFFMCLKNIITREILQTQITNPIISSYSLITIFSLISILYKVSRKLSRWALIESIARKLRTSS